MSCVIFELITGAINFRTGLLHAALPCFVHTTINLFENNMDH